MSGERLTVALEALVPVLVEVTARLLEVTAAVDALAEILDEEEA